MKVTRTILLSALWASSVSAQPKPSVVPDRQIPPMVLSELRILQNRFESAMYLDCAPERCFPKGCTYGEHAVANQPRQTSLPGLAEKQGPGSVAAQEYLTLARCTFAYEASLEPRNVKALVKRLQTKLSGGWTQVEVSSERLDPIPDSLRLAPKPPEPPEAPEAPEPVKEEAPPPEPPPVPEVWELPVAVRELWLSLLPHFAWMIAMVMGTLAAMMLIWGWRRLGRLSPEEEALVSHLGESPQEPVDAAPPTEAGDDPGPDLTSPPASEPANEFVTEQRAYWTQRLADDTEADPDLQALIAAWLRAGEMGLLAKAVLSYPEKLPGAFPGGGEYAEPKLRFSEYLKSVSASDLPTEEDFYTRLKQHALSASLGRQADTQGMASLRADFGAAGLVRFISALPPRFGALLFAHASIGDQLEASRLLSSSQVADLAEQLLLSNRMSPVEADYLVSLVAAARSAQPLPPAPAMTQVSDLGSSFDAASALSILLPLTDSAEQTALLSNAKAGFGGAFPSWYDEILWPDILLKLGTEERADVFFEADVKNLAGWITTLGPTAGERLLDGLSPTLSSAVRASAQFTSRGEQLERYHRGRLEVAAALHRQLARASISFESFVAS